MVSRIRNNQKDSNKNKKDLEQSYSRTRGNTDNKLTLKYNSSDRLALKMLPKLEEALHAQLFNQTLLWLFY